MDLEYGVFLMVFFFFRKTVPSDNKYIFKKNQTILSLWLENTTLTNKNYKIMKQL